MSNLPTTDFRSIRNIDAVDLSQHAMVEASAGTGKTYTIEQLVVRLLKEEPDLHLENILLVTFTEKATGEFSLVCAVHNIKIIATAMIRGVVRPDCGKLVGNHGK